MSWRFTERARLAVFHAQEQAARHREIAVGPDYLLLGILQVDGCTAARVLGELGLAPGQLRRAIDAGLPSGNCEDPMQDCILTPAGQQVIDLAREAAIGQGAPAGTEHLLLGVVLEGASHSARLLAAHGASSDRVRSVFAKWASEFAATSDSEKPTPAP